MIETLFSGATGDGDTVSPLLDRNYERGYLSIVFYSDEDLTTPVSPSGGTVTVTASEDGTQYGDVATISAATAGIPSTYTRPAFAGMVRYINVNMASIADANFFQVRIARYQRGQ